MAVHMSTFMRDQLMLVSIIMAGGGFGGVVRAVLSPLWSIIHLAGKHGILTHMGGHEHFNGLALFTAAGVGAVWGLIFYVPLHKTMKSFWLRAFIFSLVPTLFGLLVTIPMHVKHAGMFGINLGFLTPLYILLTTFLTWTLPAYLWIAAAGYAGSNPAFTSGSEPLLGETS